MGDHQIVGVSAAAPPELEIDNAGDEALGAEEDLLEQERVLLPEPIREHPFEVRPEEIPALEQRPDAVDRGARRWYRRLRNLRQAPVDAVSSNEPEVEVLFASLLKWIVAVVLQL